ncbi:MAG: tetratricopeptide repeat protein [Terriglobales bacterium]
MPKKSVILKLCTRLLALALATGFVAFGQQQSDSKVLNSITFALRQRDYVQAMELLRPQLQKTPGDFKLLTLEGIALSGLGKDRDALAAYNRALAISPAYLPAMEGAAQLEYKNGSDRAVPLLDHILQLRPEDPTSHAMLAVLAYKRHDCAQAAKHFRAGGEVISSQPVALSEYGSCLVTLQQDEEAIPVFRRILTLEPDDPHARYNLAVVQYGAHHAKDSADTLQPLLETNNPDPDALDLASSACEDLGDTPRAVNLLRQAIVANPRQPKYYLDFAAISFKHSSFQVGIDMLEAGLRQLPKSAPLYIARGILYIQLGQFDKGESDFETANRLDPGQASGAIAEGLAQIQQSNPDKALATVQSQLKDHPNDAFLHYLKAQIIAQNGPDAGTPQFKEAIAAAQQAAQLKPDFVLPRDLLGNLYLKDGHLEQSIEQSRLALRENPSDQEAIYHLIQALRRSGKDSKAELPALVKRLAELREESRKTEAAANRYKLYEPGKSDENH